MYELFESIKATAPGAIYMQGADVCIPTPLDADTASMVYVEDSGYVVGFVSLTEAERANVLLLLRYGTLTPLDVISLSTDSPIVIGDGVDDVLLRVAGRPSALVTVDVLTGETASTLSIQLDADGNGEQAFSCETSPTVIVFSAGDVSCKVRSI